MAFRHNLSIRNYTIFAKKNIVLTHLLMILCGFKKITGNVARIESFLECHLYQIIIGHCVAFFKLNSQMCPLDMMNKRECNIEFIF